MLWWWRLIIAIFIYMWLFLCPVNGFCMQFLSNMMEAVENCSIFSSFPSHTHNTDTYTCGHGEKHLSALYCTCTWIYSEYVTYTEHHLFARSYSILIIISHERRWNWVFMHSLEKKCDLTLTHHTYSSVISSIPRCATYQHEPGSST